MAEIGRLLTAMITPMRPDGAIDYDAAQRLAALLISDGSDGIVVAGTTGESPTLSDDEKIELLVRVKEAIPGYAVVAGTGGNDTHHSIALSRRAAEAGADAVLCVVPYYNKPPQEGMYQHFKAIAEESGAPVIMYNIQARTAINMTVQTTLRCAEIPGVIGVKEASGDIDQMSLICAKKPDAFRVWSGDDSFTLPLLAVGGDGLIGVTSHLASRAIREMITAFLRGDTATARHIHGRLLPLVKALMTTASNPVPLKSVLPALGFPAGPFRPPLTALTAPEVEKVLDAVREAGELVTFAPAGVG
ncbi:MAG TPA: 4-hydroxy-tetrahydrodipicolinate synthase [Candidatus Dormibacteraeota bacterium]